MGITMRNCDGYYFNGQVYYTKGGILHQDYRYGSDSYGHGSYGSTHYGSYGYESYGSTGYGAYGYDGYLHHDTSGGSIDSFTGKFKDNLGRQGTFTFTFDTNDTKPIRTYLSKANTRTPLATRARSPSVSSIIGDLLVVII